MTSILLALVLIVAPGSVLAQKSAAPLYSLQIGGGWAISSTFNSEASFTGTENFGKGCVGANVSWIEGSSRAWNSENFLELSARYYLNPDYSAFYPYVGAGGISRFRSGKSASDGESFFHDGIPGTHDFAIVPALELGLGSTLILTPKTFVVLSVTGNLNQFNSFVCTQISIGFSLR